MIENNVFAFDNNSFRYRSVTIFTFCYLSVTSFAACYVSVTSFLGYFSNPTNVGLAIEPPTAIEPPLMPFRESIMVELFMRHGRESRPQESAQDVKWSFCLTAGTPCPANQERHEQTTAPESRIRLQGEGGTCRSQGRSNAEKYLDQDRYYQQRDDQRLSKNAFARAALFGLDRLLPRRLEPFAGISAPRP